MARSAALEKLSAKLGSHMTITDLRGCSVVSQELFPMFENMVNESGKTAKKGAFIVDSTLSTFQVRRILQRRPDVGIFGTTAEVLAWLSSSDHEDVPRKVAKNATDTLPRRTLSIRGS